MAALLGLVLNVAVPVVLARAAMAMVPEAGLFPPVCVAYPAGPSPAPGSADARHCPLCVFHTSAADMASPTVVVHDHAPLPVAALPPDPSEAPDRVPAVVAASPRGPPRLLEADQSTARLQNR